MKTYKELREKYVTARHVPYRHSFQVAWIKLFRACVREEEGEACSLLHAKQAFERTNPDYLRMRVLEHVRDPDGRAGELLYKWVLMRMKKDRGIMSTGLAIEAMRHKFPMLTKDSMVYLKPGEEYTEPKPPTPLKIP